MASTQNVHKMKMQSIQRMRWRQWRRRQSLDRKSEISHSLLSLVVLFDSLISLMVVWMCETHTEPRHESPLRRRSTNIIPMPVVNRILLHIESHNNRVCLCVFAIIKKSRKKKKCIFSTTKNRKKFALIYTYTWFVQCQTLVISLFFYIYCSISIAAISSFESSDKCLLCSFNHYYWEWNVRFHFFVQKWNSQMNRLCSCLFVFTHTHFSSFFCQNRCSSLKLNIWFRNCYTLSCVSRPIGWQRPNTSQTHIRSVNFQFFFLSIFLWFRLCGQRYFSGFVSFRDSHLNVK